MVKSVGLTKSPDWKPPLNEAVSVALPPTSNPPACPSGRVTRPPPLDDPLLRLPNVVIAPHIASATVQTRNRMAEICARNLIAGVTGQPLEAPVNPDVEPKRRRI